jgi:hypothetical protein
VVLSIASNIDSVSKIREIVIINPEEYASIAQILIKYFDRAGLSTLRNQVLALTTSPSLTLTLTRGLPLAPSSLITQTL